MSLNKVILIGNLGRDPELRYMPNGDAVCNFSIATSESWNDRNSGQRQERTEWHNITLYRRLAEVARTQKLADIDALNAAEVAPGVTADERRRELVAKIGENMTIRRFVTLTAGSGVIGHYLHGQKIGVLVEITTGDVELAKDIAMHIAASNPISLDAASLPQDFLDKENEIHRAKAEQSGKPANIIEKMVEGAMKKLFGEVTLKGQSFVKNPDITVEQLLKEKGADVVQFTRFELGEGIEKEESDFVAEVMAQAKGV